MDPVTGAISKLAPMLVDLLKDEYKLQKGVKVQIRSLTRELECANAALWRLAEVPPEQVDPQVMIWARVVRDASYDMADILDTCRARIGDGMFSLSKVKARREIARAIEDIRSQLKEMTELRGRYADHTILGKPADETSISPSSSALYNNMPGLIGINKAVRGGPLGDGHNTPHPAEYQQITRQLVGVNQPVGVEKMLDLEKWISDVEKKKLGVMFIWGFGGAGKTTIAKALYRKLGPQFERRAMVTVSLTSDLEMVLGDILSQVQLKPNKGEPLGSASTLNRLCLPSRNKEDVLEKQRQDLKKYLGQNRYLLLIDDVCSSSVWLDIKNCLPDENDKGSRIIVTTRFRIVANTCFSCKDNDLVQPINVLSDREAENLFNKTLDECKSASKEIPERVWKMCGGLPLAVVTMAGLVASKPQMTHKDYWIKVCNSLFPESQVCCKPEELFMRIISHCYNDLDSDLKTCSLYLSIFPKGRKISRKRLTRRWIAEGFVGFIDEKHGLTVEHVAETWFTQLIERKMIEPVEHSSNGSVKSFQVHDMVLDFLISEAAKENFITVVGSHWSSMLLTYINKVRRLAVHSGDSRRANPVDSMNLSHVRSLTVFQSLEKLQFKSLKTRIVQVLDLYGCRGFKENHFKVSDICEMILLRYLNLRRTDVNDLPQNIHKLKYLETLDVRETEVQELPATVVQLERIKNILGGDKRTRKTLKLPKELKGTMKSLWILSGVEIVEGSTAASDLRQFLGLRKLAIYKIHKSDRIFSDLRASIEILGEYSLRGLIIHDESSEFLKTLDYSMSFPTDLIALQLSGRLLKLPKWLGRLHGLVKLTLSVTALKADYLGLLSHLSSLFSLTFSISEEEDPASAAFVLQSKSASGDIYVRAGGFSKLKLLRIFIPLLPSLNFAKEATPQLERIELRLKKFEGLYGLDELGMLHDVILTVDGQGNDEMTKLALKDLREGRKPASEYTLIVNECHNY